MKTIHFEVSEKDIEGYAELSGDFNPIHFDQEYAATYGFENTIAHGMLTMAKVWSVVSNELALGLRPVQYSLSFQSPVYADGQVELTIMEKEQTISIIGKSRGATVVKGTINIG